MNGLDMAPSIYAAKSVNICISTESNKEHPVPYILWFVRCHPFQYKCYIKIYDGIFRANDR